MARVRGTRIMATVGPASNDEMALRRLIRAGTDSFRFNMSHGTQAEHARALAHVRSAADKEGRPIGILIDLQGARLRTGANSGGELIPLRRGEVVTLRFGGSGAAGAPSQVRSILVPAPELRASLIAGDRLLIDDGKLRLRAEKRTREGWLARVDRGGMLKEHAGVNIPGRKLPLRVPTPKDAEDVAFALKHKADWIALSFVQSADDVLAIRKLLPTSGRRPLPLLVAKIEKPAALEQLGEILEVSDGVLVARGDMGVELSLEKVPYWQKEILRRARERGRLTITATQMLESMIHNPTPTRAEVSDVANAILDGTDALLLTAETAVGEYPVESVKMLARIAEETDPMWNSGGGGCEGGCSGGCGGGCGESCGESSGDNSADRHAGAHQIDPIDAMAHVAVSLGDEVNARLIIVFTSSGRTARLVARHRPAMPILALTYSEETQRQLTLAWNTETRILQGVGNVEAMMRRGLRLAQKEKFLRKGDRAVLLAGSGRLWESTNLLRLVEV